MGVSGRGEVILGVRGRGEVTLVCLLRQCGGQQKVWVPALVKEILFSPYKERKYKHFTESMR